MISKLQLAAAAGILSTLAFAQEAGNQVFIRHGDMGRVTTAGTLGPQTFEYVAAESFSFDGKVVKNAPYSADAVTETTQRLADGNRISRKSSASMYRDSEGRTRREESLGAIGPWASNEPSQTVFINDPVSKTNLVLDGRTKIARKSSNDFAGMHTVEGDAKFAKLAAEKMVTFHTVTGAGAGGAAGFAVAGTGEAEAKIKTEMRMRIAPDSKEKPQMESLGTQIIEGVQAEGTRTTMTIPAGTIGNDLPIQIVSERWYSPDLQTVVMSKHTDPRMGDTVYRLTNISRNEPARSLFEAPADYTVAEGNKPVLVKSKE